MEIKKQARILTISHAKPASRFFHSVFGVDKWDCYAATGLDEALIKIEKHDPDLILIHENGIRKEIDRLESFLIERQPILKNRTIFIAGSRSHWQRPENLNLSIQYLKPPFEISHFRRYLSSFRLSETKNTENQALLLSANPILGEAAERHLLEHKIGLTVSKSVEELSEKIASAKMDFVIFDDPQGNLPLEMLSQLVKFNTEFLYTPIFYIGSQLSSSKVNEVIDTGAVDVYDVDDGVDRILENIAQVYQKIRLRKNDTLLYFSWEEDTVNAAHYNFFKHGFSAICTSDGIRFFEALENFKIDIIILENVSLIEKTSALIRTLANERANIPIIATVNKREQHAITRLYQSGVDDCLVRPYYENEMIFRIETHIRLKKSLEELEKQNGVLNKLSLTDELTGLHNRRYMESSFEHERNKAEEGQYNIGFCLIDIDRFKKINDNFGHLAGDQILAQMSRLLIENNYYNDLIVRFGGEEIAVLVINTDQNNLIKRAENYRRLVENFTFLPGSHSIHITISIGTTLKDPDKKISIKTMATKADEALYLCKERGRNRVEFLPLD